MLQGRPLVKEVEYLVGGAGQGRLKRAFAQRCTEASSFLFTGEIKTKQKDKKKVRGDVRIVTSTIHVGGVMIFNYVTMATSARFEQKKRAGNRDNPVKECPNAYTRDKLFKTNSWH